MFQGDHVAAIKRHAASLVDYSDPELRELGLESKFGRQKGDKSKRFIVRSLALAVEAARRSLGLHFHSVQIFAGLQMCLGKLVEMKTGEGKTLTSLLPIFYYGMGGRGVHVFTVNDYLAERDYHYLRPALESLGLTAREITSGTSHAERTEAYHCDVTFATCKEFGFDFLRDRMRPAEGRMQRELAVAIVDEADSVMIDEARTPLIIGLPSNLEENARQRAIRWAAQYANEFVENIHYRCEANRFIPHLISAGRLLTRALSTHDESINLSMGRLYHAIQNAIKVQRDFVRDRHYAVIDEKIVIIDEFTGRLAEGRQWQDGIHQAVEAREGLEITASTKQGAGITMQNFLNRYEVLTGMTGTAWTARREFAKVYRKKTKRIPTNKPVNRVQYTTRILSDWTSKMEAVASECRELIASGRSVLVGTRSVEKSDSLSRFLENLGVEHQILNARYLAQEAQIVSQAGEPGRVTVATNMAGRGTDILLAKPVRDAGGLHVILTEIHESQRIDWQLIGRCARQGDPGSFRIFLSAEDEILKLAFGEVRASNLSKMLRKRTPISPRYERIFRWAQLKLEAKYLTLRMSLLKRDQDHQKQYFDMGLDPYLHAST